MQLDNKRNQQQQQQIEGTATVWMSDSLESINSTNDDSLTTDDEQQQQQQNTNNSSSTTTTPSSKKVFVLSGRRRKKSKTYLIGNNAFDISRDRCIAKLKSNVLGTQFTSIRLHSNGVRHEISSITYVCVWFVCLWLIILNNFFIFIISKINKQRKQMYWDLKDQEK